MKEQSQHAQNKITYFQSMTKNINKYINNNKKMIKEGKLEHLKRKKKRAKE